MLETVELERFMKIICWNRSYQVITKKSIGQILFFGKKILSSNPKLLNG